MSHTKFWSNVGYGVFIYAFIIAVQTNQALPEYFYLFMGSVLLGNRTILKVLEHLKPVQKTS